VHGAGLFSYRTVCGMVLRKSVFRRSEMTTFVPILIFLAAIMALNKLQTGTFF
jgi:hypothetical protein